MPIRCEIDFPLLPTLTVEDRQRLAFEAPVAVYAAYRLEDVPAAVEAAARAARQGDWCVGFVAYEAAPAFDAALAVQPPADVAGPLVWFGRFAAPLGDRLAMAPAAAFALDDWQTDTPPAAFARAVGAIRAEIRDGRFYQVNFTTRRAARFDGDTLAFYRALQQEQPGGYHAYIDTGDGALLSVSPELFFAMRDGSLVAQPMKGTAPRGDSPEEDARLADALNRSEKERAENLMIVDLLRNDVSRLAVPGGVEVPSLFTLHPLPSVWQMTSTVRARLRPDATLVDIFRALFPCGSVTGAPKVEAMRAIREREAAPRGAYCGAVGILAPDGSACFNVAIRSVWVRAGRAAIGVGGGITYDSNVAGEAAEVEYKARFAVRASRAFSLLETIRLEHARYIRLDRHLARMARSARHFRFRFDEQAIEAALSAVRQERPHGVFRVRLLSDRAGRCRVEVGALDGLPPAPVVRLARGAVSSDDEFLRHKTTRRETYEAHAPADSGWFDTLLYNERGEITEFTRANVALEWGGQRFTPPLSSGLLNGVLRSEWLARGILQERVLTLDDLARCERLIWLNGLRGEVTVTLADGEWPRAGRPGMTNGAVATVAAADDDPEMP